MICVFGMGMALQGVIRAIHTQEFYGFNNQGIHALLP